MKKYFAGFLTCLILMSGFYALAESQQWTALRATFDIFINDQKFETDKPIVAIEGSTYLPLKAIGEVLNVSVDWNEEQRRVEIKNNINKLYKVTKVIDGDTFKINYNEKEETVRLIGVDTPESVHPDKENNTEFGIIVSEYSKSQLEGRQVRLEFDVNERDKYGRLLAYVYVDDIFYNAKLIELGYAQVMTVQPNIKYIDTFKDLQKTAMKNKVGMWSFIEIESDPDQVPVKTEGNYVGSKNSNKVHDLDCRWVKEIEAENTVYFNSLEDAKASGYEPCGVCKPK